MAAMSAAGGTSGAAVSPVPPPLYYGVALGVGLALQRRWPMDVPAGPAPTAAGTALLAAGVGLAGGGVATVLRHGTTIVPHRPVSELQTGGVFALSRNPMYAGLGLAVAGGSLLARTWWPAVLLPAALLAVRRLVIDPEEAYLADRFGPQYADYRAGVRRWL